MSDPAGQTQADALGEAATLPAGTLIAERYRVIALLGEGGMGAVYQAEHVLMRKTVAVKVLHPQLTLLEEVVQRFEREAIAAGRIDHPNVASATDFGRLPNGAFYLVLEYVSGGSLRELLEKEGALLPERALHIARQVGLALRAAHAANIVHRDLKPDNVMLTPREGGTESIKVLDFGIAQVKGEDLPHGPLTRLGAVFGTPQYMAPEQAAGQAVDQRADLYAVGLMLHEMLRGRPTFEGDDVMALLSKQLTELPAPLSEKIPLPVRQLVADLLQKDVSARVQSAQELVTRLDALLGLRATQPSFVDAGLQPDSAGQPILKQGKRALRSGWRWLGARLRPLHARASRGLREGAARFPPVRRFVNGPPVLGLERVDWLLMLPFALTLLALFVARGFLGSAPVPAAGTVGPGVEREALGEAERDERDEPTGADTDDQLEAKLRKLIRLARQGDATALDALELRPLAERSVPEWLALAEGRLKQKESERALSALEQALEKDQKLILSQGVMAGLRAAADRPEQSERVLKFASERLGSVGADLLFHVWAGTSLVTDSTRLARQLLYSDAVSASWSPALRIALDLRDAKDCPQFQALLERAVDYADERSLKPLKDLKSEQGCGDNRRKDCFPCLRADKRLDSALLQAQLRKAPRYDTGR